MSGFASVVTGAISNTASPVIGGAMGPANRQLSYIANMNTPNALPDVAAVTSAFLRGFISRDHAWSLMQMHGAYWPFDDATPNMISISARADDVPIYQAGWKATLDLQKSWLTPEETLVAFNRGLYTRSDAERNLTRLGYADAWERERFLDLRWQIPGPSDLVRFAVREVWDAAVVGLYRYDDEFPAEFKEWMRKQGLGGDARTDAQKAANNYAVTWPEMYWRAHWQMPSPTQSYEMFHRLRPNRMHLYTRTVPDARPFLLSDLETVLKIEDYAPSMRAELAAISYNKPRLLDLQRFYAAGLIDVNELYEQHLDYGYAPDLAWLRTRWIVQAEEQKKRFKVGANPSKAILAAYKQGLLAKNDAAVQLYRTTIATAAKLAIFDAQDANAQVTEALKDVNVKAALEQVDLEWYVKSAERKTKRIKRRYQRGQWNAQRARQQLATIGTQPAMVNELLDEWDDELSAGKLMLSTAHIRNLVVKGLLPLNTARIWLFNLGWRSPELDYLLTEVQRDVAMEFAKAMEKRAKTADQRRKALAQQMQAANKAKQQAMNKLLATITPARATKYFVQGVFALGDLQAALVKHGYQGQALTAALASAQIERNEALEKRAKQKAKEQAEQAKQAAASSGGGP